jgi:Na+/H+-translocating membrane pyrophosphatase
VIITVVAAIQLFESVTVAVYGPAISPVAVAAVCTGVVLHVNVYGPVPPAGIAVAEPVELPKQSTFTCDELTESAAAG